MMDSGGQYLGDYDLAWLAMDSLGQVAAFVTAGEGPVPRAVMSHPLDEVFSAEAWANQLPVTGGCRLSVVVPRPDTYMAFSTRGIYVYDWDGKVYRLASSPDSPVSNVAIPPKLRSLAGSVQLAGQFGVQLEFVLEVELDCVGPAHPL